MKVRNGEFYHGDCLDVMRGFPNGSIDLTITSPPYNLREGMEDKGGQRSGHKTSAWAASTLKAGYNTHSDDMPYREYCAWQKEVLETIWAKTSETGAIFYNHKPRMVKGVVRLPFFCDLPLRQVIIWDRGSGFNHLNAAFKPVCEWILLYAKPGFVLKSKGHSTVGDVWRFSADRGNSHPAPFPVALPDHVLSACDGQMVFDPFGGSGTVAVSAEKHRRQWISIERDETYYWDAVARLAGGEA